MSFQSIYLVEDNQDNSDLFCAFLSDRYNITCFRTGLELLTHLGAGVQRLPDLFVLDISLPGMDGVSLMKRIRGDYLYRDIPVLALTAHAMADDKRRLIQAGFDWYLCKPIMEEELYHVIDGLITKSLT
ncbi:MAG: response regulator [Verrucomicrobia bacterium]|nr:response regulator [Verrucomicrobiota bacterium]MDA1067923.1 response regulator [Verrucomicrobiota bacterium]